MLHAREIFLSNKNTEPVHRKTKKNSSGHLVIDMGSALQYVITVFMNTHNFSANYEFYSVGHNSI